MQVIKVLALAALAVGCGRFDYNAQEFKDVSDSAKAFENLSSESVAKTIGDLMEQKMSAASFKGFRESMTRVIQAIGSTSVSPFSLTDTDRSEGMYLGDETNNLYNGTSIFLQKYVYDNPALKKKISDDREYALVDGHLLEEAKYISMVRNLLVSTRGVFSDASLVLYFLLEDKKALGNEYKFDGSVLENLAAPSRVRGLLPEKYQSFRIDAAFLQPENSDDPKLIRLRVKDGEGADKIKGYLTTIPKEIVSSDSALQSMVYKDGGTVRYKHNYYVIADGKDTKMENVLEGAKVAVYLGFTPSTDGSSKDAFELMVRVSKIACQDANPSVANAFGYTAKKSSGSTMVRSRLVMASDRMNGEKTDCGGTAPATTDKGLLWVDTLQNGVTIGVDTDILVKAKHGTSDVYYGSDRLAIAMSYSAYDKELTESQRGAALSTVESKGSLSIASGGPRNVTSPKGTDFACIDVLSVFDAPKRLLAKSEVEKAFWKVYPVSGPGTDVDSRPYWKARPSDGKPCNLSVPTELKDSNVSWNYFFRSNTASGFFTELDALSFPTAFSSITK